MKTSTPVIKSFALFLIVNFLLQIDNSFSQNIQKITATKGKEFWLGFMTNYEPGEPGERLDIFITSNVSTTGTVSIPAQGYTQNFTVTANVTTTVNLANGIAETISTEVVDNKGIFIQTQDTVSVYAINFDDYTADGTLVLPYGSLGTDYRVTSYVGLQGYTYNSEFLIVATQDGTQVEIIPSANTMGGKTAGNAYIINLNAGQTYRVEAQSDAAELTGSTVRGTPQNGTCRPFAVFSGVECVNIPVGCTACDHIYEQEYPTNIWGKGYMIVPFNPMVQYSYKVLANTNGTTFTINGGGTQNLNAGQWYSASNITTPVLIAANNKISVTQFMQGATCDPSGTGDPAQLLLSPVDQVLTDVTFSTVSSTVITTHKVNLIMKAAFTSQLKLDGISVGGFSSFTPNPQYSYAQISLTQGSHTLTADSGFIAYAYGIGGYETYAYALGSFNEETIIPTDTVYCTTDSITLSPPETVLNPEWTTISNPGIIIGTGQTLTVTPSGSEIYMVSGTSAFTGCPYAYKFSVETPEPPELSYSVSNDSICKFESVNFNLSVVPYSPNYLYNWYPTVGLDNPYISNPIATPLQSTWYHVTVSTPSGCGTKTDSIYIYVRPGGNVSQIELTADKTLFCLGDTAQLNLAIENIVFEDSINPNYNPALWSSISGGVASNSCGSGSGNALYFNSAGNRFAATSSMNTTNGGTLYFALKIANGTAPCENADAGEDVVLEYSINSGVSWTIFNTYNENGYSYFTSLSAAIPAAAQTTNTRFRWRQLSNSGAGQDNWALDDIYIGIKNNSNSTFIWSPAQGLSDTTITNPLAYPTSATMYQILVVDTNTNCDYTDSVFINVGQPFTLSVPDDDTICQISGISLFANPSIPGTYSYLWTPSETVSNDTISNPLATPTSTTTYSITVNSIQGCSYTESVTIYVPAISQFFSTPEADSLCAGDSVQITTTYQKACGTNASVCGGTTTVQIGTATTTTTNNNGTLYNGTSLSSRFQLLFTKAELNAVGITQASTITEIGFRVGTVAGSNIYQNFKIKMGCTNLTALTSSYVPNLSTVFNPKNVVISANVLYYILDNTFDWDGTSNIIVEVCYNNSVASANSSTYYSAAGFNSFLATSSASACNTATGTLSANKPNTYFKYCSAPAQNGLSFLWSPSAGLNDDTIPNPLATPASSTMYHIYATDDATGCIYTDSVFVSVGPSFTLSTTDTIVTCNTEGVQISATPDISGNYIYSWSPAATLSNAASGSPIATPASTTQYDVSVTSEYGCTKYGSVMLMVPALATFYATPASDTVCTGQQVQLNSIFQKGCGVNGSVCSGTPTAVQIGTATTTSAATNTTIYKGSVNSSRIQMLFRKTELNAAGINSASTLTSLGFNIQSIAGSNIYQNFTIKIGCTSLTALTTNFASGTQTVFNPKNVVITSGVNYYNFDANFDWDGISNILVEICFTNSVASSNSTIYYSATSYNSVVYTTGNSGVCATATGITSTSRANTYFKYCAANAGSGLSFQWSPSVGLDDDTIPNPLASPLVSTMYTVSATDDATGCIFTDSVFIQSDTNTILSLGNDTVFCTGGSVMLIPGSFQSYVWNDGTTVSTKTITSSGLYWVQVSNACGTQRDSVQITISGSPINLNLGNDTAICNGSNIVLNVYDSSYISYSWNNNSTDSAINVTSSGTYIVTVTSDCGSSSDTVSISFENAAPVNLGNDQNLCDNNTVTLNAGSGYNSYLWQDSSVAQTFSVQSSGTYFVAVTSVCGTFYDTINVNYSFSPTVELGNDITICENDSVTLTVNNCSNCSYFWSGSSNDSTFVVTQEGTVSVLVVNQCGTAQDAINVFANALPDVELGNDTSFCGLGSVIPLEAFCVSCIYSWNTGQTSPSINVTSAGTYSVDVTNNCGTVSDMIAIDIIPVPAVDLGENQFICNGNSVLLSAGNSADFQYEWQPFSTDSVFLATSGGIYSVTVSNSCGSDVDTVLVSEGFLPNVELGNPISFCEGNSTIISAQTDSSYQYLWNDSSTNSSITVDSSGMYFVNVTNGCGMAGDTVQVTVNPFPVVELGNDTTLCITDTIKLNVTQPNCTYLWENNSTEPLKNIISDGKYYVEISFSDCKTSDTITVYKQLKPSVALRSDTAVCPGDEVLLEVFNSNYEYEWQDGSTNTFFTARDSGWYFVKAKNICGTKTDSVLIKNKDCICHVDVPSAFSPNGDGANEILYLRGNCVTDINFYVYDRWGQLVFESHDLSVGWDGTFKGKKMDTAVFVYYLSSKSFYEPEGEATVKKGNISLIR